MAQNDRANIKPNRELAHIPPSKSNSIDSTLKNILKLYKVAEPIRQELKDSGIELIPLETALEAYISERVRAELKNSPKAEIKLDPEGVSIIPLDSYWDNPATNHDVPCNICGSSHWTDWRLLPHKLFNMVGTGGGGYYCFPCFVAEWVRLGLPLTSEQDGSQKASSEAELESDKK